MTSYKSRLSPLSIHFFNLHSVVPKTFYLYSQHFYFILHVRAVLLRHVQPEMRESVALFMANVHKSVNDMSEVYLTNERRYNYTTPKSFLEQIKLYQNLLQSKFDELQAKTVRLENGLEKLKTTSAQASI